MAAGRPLVKLLRQKSKLLGAVLGLSEGAQARKVKMREQTAGE